MNGTTALGRVPIGRNVLSVSPDGPNGGVTRTMMTGMTDVAALYRQHASELIRYATVLVGPDDAGEVVSDAVLGAARTRWDEIDNPRAYLFRCVHNRAMSQKRSTLRRLAREQAAWGRPPPRHRTRRSMHSEPSTR